MDELQERINELEIRFTHQARLLDELNNELIEANRRIDMLERESNFLRETLKSLAPELSESPDE